MQVVNLGSRVREMDSTGRETAREPVPGSLMVLMGCERFVVPRPSYFGPKPGAGVGLDLD